MEEQPSESSAQADLDRFREEWLSEVARNKRPGRGVGVGRFDDNIPRRRPSVSTAPVAGPSGVSRDDYSEAIEPRSYHDLPDKETALRLGRDGEAVDRYVEGQPSTALEHYEHAVEKETRGQLGDSIKHYRKAFKLDDGVHEAYKKKYFPPSSFVKSIPSNPNPSNAAVTVPGTGHHSLHGSSGGVFSTSLKQLLDEFAELRIEAAPPATSLSAEKPCPISRLPEEILGQILERVAVTDVACLARVALVCKRLAYLVMTDQSIWKRITVGQDFGFGAMLYDFTCDIEGFPLDANDEIAKYLGSDESVTDETDEEVVELPPTPEERAIAFSALTEKLLQSTYANSWRQMFRSRPRIRFNGCYISTVNYTRPGAASVNNLYWGAPVHVVTYYRYLRFFRDGTVISLLTTSEPADVIHHLIKDNLHHNHNNTLPSSVMKDALVGRWRLSGLASSVLDPATKEPEVEGDVHIETEGVVPKYFYKMLLAMAHAGKGARNNKLAWKGFWSYNRLTDDWGEFGLKNDRAFYWSRVRSYGMGY